MATQDESTTKQRKRTKEEQALHHRYSEAAQIISDQLAETEEEPRRLIYRIVKHLGIDPALEFLQKTHELEAAGGLMLPDGSRRRTCGGVFFYLVRHESPAAISKAIFPPAYRRRKKQLEQKEQAGSTTPARPTDPPQGVAAAMFTWEDRFDVLTTIALEERGEVKSVKITLIGRPGKIVQQGQCIVTTMQQQPQLPALPKGLPIPTPDQIEATLFAVYIASKQWRKVEEAIKNADDLLIVEGVQVLEKKLPGTISVFASNVTTKLLQTAQRQGAQQGKEQS